MSSCKASSSPDVPLLWKGNTFCVHSQLVLIMDSLLPFHICKQERLYGHLKHARFNLDTLMQNAGLLIKFVEQKISVLLPDRFVLVFDGWCNARTDYVAIFSRIQWAQIVDLNLCVWLSLHLWMSNVGQPGKSSTWSILYYFIFVKSSSNVVSLIADNLSVDMFVAELLDCNFVRFPSHFFKFWPIRT